MASIRKRGNSYQIRVSAGYDINGKQLTKQTTWTPSPGMTERQIEKELNRQATLFEESVRNGLTGDNKQNFAEYSRYVIELKERSGLKVSTIERYESFMELTNKAIGHIKLCELHPKHLNDFYKQLAQDGMNQKTGGKLSNKTILEYHRFISSVLSQAEKELLISFNPARKATPPKVEKTDVNYFQIDETQKILEHLITEPLKHQLIVMLLMVTGCRRGEVLGLKWNKIDKESRTIHIENNVLYSSKIGVYETTTKTRKTRKVKFPAELLPILSAYQKEFIKLKLNNGDRWQGAQGVGVVGSERWIENDFVFVQNDGKPMHPDSVTDWQRKFSKRHNLPHVNPKAFRHTVASILISQGVDVVTVSKQLGHNKVSTTTDIYSHIIERASEQAAETLSGVIFQKKVN